MSTTITGLPNATTPLSGTERVPMDQSGATKDATTQDIANLAPGTDLSYTAATRVLASSTGADATLPVATTSDAGLLSAADKTKLDGVAAGATANSSDATLLARANHTGTQAGSTVTGAYTAAGLTMATARLLGRGTAGTGAAEEITVGTGLSLSNGTLTATATGGGTKTLRTFTPLDNQPPATNFATLDTRNSIALLDFDAATEESAVFVGNIPEGATLTSGIAVRISWAATTATSGDCVWGVQFEKTTGQDIDSDSFDTATTGTTTTNAASGFVNTTTITCTSIDSLAAGDCCRVKVYRAATAVGDTMTGDAELITVELREVA